MNFSVRDILALTFVAALAAMAWTSTREKLRGREKLVATRIELGEKASMLEATKLQNEYSQAEIDWFAAKAEVAQSAVEHFPSLQDKYGKIEPRGADTVSLRSVPMIVDQDYDGDNWRMRILVPDGRVLFLKFGVARKLSLWQPIPEHEWLRSSPFDPTGPFEMQLSEGIHDVDVANRKTAKEQRQQFRLSVDNHPVMVTTVELDGVSGASSEWPSPHEQIDFPVTRPYPLRQSRLDATNEAKVELMFRVWLENSSSEFARFPPASVPASSGAAP